MKPSTDTNRLYALLRKLQNEGLRPEETNELSNEVFNMAGNNVVTQFNANMKALQAQLIVMCWMLGVGLSLLGLLSPDGAAKSPGICPTLPGPVPVHALFFVSI